MVQIRSLVFCFAAALGAGGCVGGSVVTDGTGGTNSTTGLGAGGTIVRNGSAKCLGVKAGATANATIADQYTCNGTAAQNWALQTTATAGEVNVVNVNSGRCLDIKSNATADNTTI
ncbi:MAG TPA: RICIN domain-containing protein, partial [Polyangia bacterium]|nr:RICIN domain-containing protein [Polyangia bacterium]